MMSSDTGDGRLNTVVAFDLDGVLADTRHAVTEAYRRVGVKMPDDAWGKPMHEWLPSIVGSTWRATILHGKKQQVYGKLVAEGKITALPGVLCARRLSHPLSRAHTGVVTGASAPSAYAVLQAIDCKIPVWGDSCTTNTKIDVLQTIRSLRPERTHVYVDDSAVGEMIADGAGWHFVHYTTQDSDQLTQDVMQWTQ